MSGESTITPAMKKWLQFLLGGGEIKQLGTCMYACYARNGLTYVMVHKLAEAGLIAVENRMVVLTDAGKHAAV